VKKVFIGISVLVVAAVPADFKAYAHASPIKRAAITTTTILQFGAQQQQQQQQGGPAAAGAAADDAGAGAGAAAAGAAADAAGAADAAEQQQQQPGQQLPAVQVTRRYETPETDFEAQTVDWTPLADLRCLNHFTLKGHSSQVGPLLYRMHPVLQLDRAAVYSA